MRNNITLLTAFLLSWTMISCGSGGDSSHDDDGFSCPESYVDKGGRILGMDILDTSETGSFDEGCDQAERAGIDFFSLHLTWSQIETSKETYSDPFGGALATFNEFCDARGLRLSLTIRPIDITGKTVPADLASTRFNDPMMIARFKKLVDFVFSKISHSRLTSLQVGNEIDGYDTSAEHQDFWSDYGAFLFDIKSHAAANYPGLKVGFTGTFRGLTEGALHDLGIFTALASVVDVVGVTYYPMTDDFTVRDPDAVGPDLDALVAEFPVTPIYLQEVGYQTSAACDSSEGKQERFFCAFFQAWDAHAGSIGLANIARLYDSSRAHAEELAGPYGIGDESFIEYLRTLGLRTFEGKGSDKPAFLLLVEQAILRGW